MLQDPNLKITITIERLKRNSITVDSIKTIGKSKILEEIGIGFSKLLMSSIV